MSYLLQEQYKNGTRPIEKNFDKNLIEHLNWEIVLGNIYNLNTAVDTLNANNFFALNHPKFYNVPNQSGPGSLEEVDLYFIGIWKNLKLI